MRSGASAAADHRVTVGSAEHDRPHAARADLDHEVHRGQLALRLTVKQTLRGRKVMAITARKPKKTHRTVGLGQTNLTLLAGKSKTVKVFLNGKGKGLVAKRHKLKVRLNGTQSLANKKNNTV